jgi:hypothetical protein
LNDCKNEILQLLLGKLTIVISHVRSKLQLASNMTC